MKPQTEWLPKQLALAVYVHLYGAADLGMPLDDILRLAGLSQGQWTTRLEIDFPAQDGTSNFMSRIDSWYDDYIKFKRMPRTDLLQLCVRYLETMRGRKTPGR